MEAKYNQMRYGYQKGGGYYPGGYQTTPLRGTHPYGGSWIKASNDPATSGQYWPGKVLGVDWDVTDVEQQFAVGPRDVPPGESVNGIWVLGVNGVDLETCLSEGNRWLAGEITDEEKNSLVFSAKDSLFKTMRQAKAVYESATFDDGHGGERYASSRPELEAAFGAAISAGRLALSPPAPATFTVNSGNVRMELSWTLNSTTSSDIAGWRVYRAMGSYKGDSVFTRIAELPPTATGYTDWDVGDFGSYYYYLTTYDADGHESMMHTRTSTPAGLWVDAIQADARPLVFSLSQNAPNPFNPTTSIRFTVPARGTVSLAVYDVSGRVVRVLVDRTFDAGPHEAVWDGTDSAGRPVASGIYLYRLEAAGNVRVRRMVLVR